MTFTRLCLETSKTNEIRRKYKTNKEYMCSDLMESGHVKYKKCHFPCTYADGKFDYWTAWSEWKCDNSCEKSNYTAVSLN
jgi:hypothetical protein